MLQNEELGLLQKETLFDSLKKENFELKMRIYLLSETLNDGQIDYIEQISQLKSNLRESEIQKNQLLNELSELQSLQDFYSQEEFIEKYKELENDNLHLASLIHSKEKTIDTMTIFIKYEEEKNKTLMALDTRDKDTGPALREELEKLWELNSKLVFQIQELQMEIVESRQEFVNENSSLKEDIKDRSLQVLQQEKRFQEIQEENQALLLVQEENSALIASLENRISKLKVIFFLVLNYSRRLYYQRLVGNHIH